MVLNQITPALFDCGTRKTGQSGLGMLDNEPKNIVNRKKYPIRLD
jgi:hypothetical protein